MSTTILDSYSCKLIFRGWRVAKLSLMTHDWSFRTILETSRSRYFWVTCFRAPVKAWCISPEIMLLFLTLRHGYRTHDAACNITIQCSWWTSPRLNGLKINCTIRTISSDWPLMQGLLNQGWRSRSSDMEFHSAGTMLWPCLHSTLPDGFAVHALQSTIIVCQDVITSNHHCLPIQTIDPVCGKWAKIEVGLIHNDCRI